MYAGDMRLTSPAFCARGSVSFVRACYFAVTKMLQFLYKLYYFSTTFCCVIVGPGFMLLQIELERYEVFETQHLYSGTQFVRSVTFSEMMASYYGAGMCVC